MVTSSADFTKDQLIKHSITQANDIEVTSGANPCSIRVLDKSLDPVPYVRKDGNVALFSFKAARNLKQDNEKKPAAASEPNISTMTSSESPDGGMLERKDNPYWPFENEEVQKFDKQYGLPEPAIS